MRSRLLFALHYYFDSKTLNIIIINDGSSNWIGQITGFNFHKSKQNFWLKTINIDLNKSIYEKIKYFFDYEKPKLEAFITQNIALDSENLVSDKGIGIDNINYIKQLRIRKQQLSDTKFIGTTKKAMPIALRYLEVKNFRGIDD